MRLNDLEAQPWDLELNGKYLQMKALSIRNFCHAAQLGITLERLSDSEDKTAWIELLLFLANVPKQEWQEQIPQTQRDIMMDPLGAERFKVAIVESMEGAGAVTKKTSAAKNTRRRVAKFKPKEEGSQKKDTQEQQDYDFLLDTARIAKISITEIMGMTYHGMNSITASLERVPPQMGMF